MAGGGGGIVDIAQPSPAGGARMGGIEPPEVVTGFAHLPLAAGGVTRHQVTSAIVHPGHSPGPLGTGHIGALAPAVAAGVILPYIAKKILSVRAGEHKSAVIEAESHCVIARVGIGAITQVSYLRPRICSGVVFVEIRQRRDAVGGPGTDVSKSANGEAYCLHPAAAAIVRHLLPAAESAVIAGR